MKYSFKSYCSYFLFFFLCACGVKGPLFFPPPSPAPSKPIKEEPIGKLYPIENSSKNLLPSQNSDSKNLKSTIPTSDNMTTITPTIKK